MKKRKGISRASKSPHKLLEAECNKLWSTAIKLKAGNKSELSGKTEGLHAHHICGKPNYRLRFEIANGICLTAGEHFYVAHNTGRQEEFRRRVMLLRGADIFDRLYDLKWDQCKSDLSMVKIYLKSKIKEYEGALERERLKDSGLPTPPLQK